MSTPRKRHPKGVDYISNLPDVLLCYILSFMHTKDAIMSSGLSKRWKFLWTKVDVLDFAKLLGINNHMKLTSAEKVSLRNTVDRIILHNNQFFLRQLKFHLHTDFDDFYINSWLSALSKRDIGKISIWIPGSNKEHVPLPSGFLSNEKLVSLEIIGRLSITNTPTMSMQLTNLASIHLVALPLIDNGFLNKILSACPVLKKLVLENCCMASDSLLIESSSLKTLRVKDNTSNSDDIPELVIKAPNLRYLILKGEITPRVENYLKLLVEADIDIEGNEPDDTLQLLENISGVVSLRLKISEFIDVDSEPPIFVNLTNVEFPNEIDLGDMGKLLNSAPKLKSLIIENDINYGEIPIDFQVLPMDLSTIERIKFLRFEDSDDNRGLVAHFLKEATTLKDMKLFVNPDELEEVILLLDWLCALPRSSSSCQARVIHQN